MSDLAGDAVREKRRTKRNPRRKAPGILEMTDSEFKEEIEREINKTLAAMASQIVRDTGREFIHGTGSRKKLPILALSPETRKSIKKTADRPETRKLITKTAKRGKRQNNRRKS